MRKSRTALLVGALVAATAIALPQAMRPADATGDGGSAAAQRTIEVGDSEELQSALEGAQAGDRIVLADGEYEIGSMSDRHGTEREPITVVAANRGEAVISEGQLEVENSSYVTFQGLSWTNSDTLKLTSSHHVRLTRNHFRLTEEESLKWVLIQGADSHHNRVDHNLFEEKHQLGNFITIDGSETQQSQHDRIDHNHFRAIGPRAENEMEAIRVGWSEISESSGNTVVEHNLFEECDGDPEIVSVKSNDNIVRYNTFRRSQGTLTLRHGNGSQVYGNFFLGEGKQGTGGVRVYGQDHTIYNNYFEGLTGTGYDAALQLDGGDVDTSGSLDSHFRVYRATVVHNTFVNNVSNIEIGANYEHPPADSVIADNVIAGGQGKLVNELKQPEDLTYAGNIAWPTGDASVGVDVPADAIREVDPGLVEQDGLRRLGSDSPAIDAGTGAYEFVTDDMDGQERAGTPDVGADERSSADVIRQPLTPQDVGPDAPAGNAAGPAVPAAAQDGGLEILPGHLIGQDREPDMFYVRSGSGDQGWQLTQTSGWQGEGFSEAARGTLPNLRSANAIFDDLSGQIHDYDEEFDPRANTEAFVGMLDTYREHGLLATDVNLQGGNPGFDGAENPAFTAEGELRQAWKERAAQVIEAHAERNMVVVLGFFYFHQDHVLQDEEAVRQAVTNATDWLIQNDYRNVIIEIANEHNLDSYDHDIIRSDEGMAELIRLAQSRFEDADFRLAVSTSRAGDGSWPDGAVAEAADLALVHCNGVDPQECADNTAEHRQDYDYPIVVNEDDNTAGSYAEENLEAEKESFDLLTAQGVSWGFMLNQWNQYAPCRYDEDCGSSSFDWTFGEDPGANGEGADLLRNFAHGVADHVQSVVFETRPQP